jgi:cytoskeletal protein CcmA (bactofilin family)
MMNTEKFAGIGSINGGEYDVIKIEGVSKLKGDVRANLIDVLGVFTSKGRVNTKDLLCEGVGEFEKNVKAEKINVQGIVRMKNNAKLTADEIKCEGIILSNAEISADQIAIDGCVQADEVTGDTVTILSLKKSFISKIPFDLSKAFGEHWYTNKNQNSNVGLVEATTIHLQGVKAKQVNGENITIGVNCDIEAVDCTGTLKLHPSSRIGVISGGVTPEYISE